MNSAKPLITLLTPRGKKKAETKGRWRWGEEKKIARKSGKWEINTGACLLFRRPSIFSSVAFHRRRAVADFPGALPCLLCFQFRETRRLLFHQSNNLFKCSIKNEQILLVTSKAYK
jgi:hypothetical protein